MALAVRGGNLKKLNHGKNDHEASRATRALAPARARDDGRQLRLEAQRHLLARSLWPQVAGGASDLLRRRAQWAIDGGCAAPRTAMRRKLRREPAALR